MGNRITASIIQRTALSDVMRARLRLAEVQEQASSGLRINRPSDDPVGYRSASALRASIEANDQLLRNQDRAEGRMRRADGALGEVQNVLARARELALQGASGSDAQDPATRRILAEEVAGLFDQLLAQANTKGSEGYLFAGFASDTVPFAASGPFGSAPPAPTVAFGADPSEVEVEIDEGVRVATTLDGRATFMGDSDGDGAPDAGREDLFDTLGDLWAALMSNDGAATAATLDRLDSATTQVSAARTRLAASAQRTEAARQAVRDRGVEFERQLSNVQDADTVSVLSELVSRETALQAALQAAARLMQPSLLDFLG